MRRKDPKIIREGDWVEVAESKVVKRIGYPKCLADFLPEAERLLAPVLKEAGLASSFGLLRYAETGEIACALHRELAYKLLRKAKFGGPERSLHLEEAPALAGKKAKVLRLRTVYTGTYDEGWSGRSGPYGEDWDSQPPSLAVERAHRLATLSSFSPDDDAIQEFLFKGRYEAHAGLRFWHSSGHKPLEIPTYWLKKVEPDAPAA